MTRGWEGLLLVDKPAGPTSHDVVDGVRRATGERRVGHTGTLDPPATGLLVLVLGRATRLARFLPASPKIYEGTLRLGVTTSTDDLAGSVSARHDGALPASDEVARVATGLIGRQWQAPPAVSARKVGGERLYRLARRGVAVAAPPAEILVARFDVAPTSRAGIVAFSLEVSAGTYVRALVRDLGTSLGCGAAVETLRRTAIGPLSVGAARIVATPGPLDPRALAEGLIPIGAMPFAVPCVVAVGHDAASSFASGKPVEIADPPATAGGTVIVRSETGLVLGAGELAGSLVRPRVVLVAPGRTPDDLALPGREPV